MSRSSQYALSFALSTLAHTGLGMALCYSPLLERALASQNRSQPSELEFYVLGLINTHTIDNSIEAPTPVDRSTVHRAKRSPVRKPLATFSPALCSKTTEEKAAAEMQAHTSNNSADFQDASAVKPTGPAFRQASNGSEGVESTLSSGSSGSGTFISASINSGQATKESQWNRIRAAIERYIEYPRMGRRFGWTGKVLLRFKLMADGRVREARVDQSSGYALLDQSALQALERASPLPQPAVSTEITMPIVFALK